MTVLALFTQKQPGSKPDPQHEVVLIKGGGIQSDIHEHRKTRSVVLMSTADLNQLGLNPGDLREQITVDTENLMGLEAGTQIDINGNILEIDGDCEPCTHIGELLGVEDREAFRQTLLGHRGKLARVIHTNGSAKISIGDPVIVNTNS
jgi:MOSC domain-containing protein YiiM